VDLEVEEQEGSRGSPGTEEEREQEPTNEDLDTSKKRKTTSDVWAHFTRKKVEGKVKAQCHHCGKLYLGDCFKSKIGDLEAGDDVRILKQETPTVPETRTAAVTRSRRRVAGAGGL